MEKVFTYGILRTGEEDKQAILPGFRKFYRTHATITKDENSFVVGEIHEVDDKMLGQWDLIEGLDTGYYHRMSVTARWPNGEDVEVWVYQQTQDKEEDNG